MVTSDPSSDPAFRAAWQSAAGDGLAAQLARQSLSAIATKIDPQWRPLGSTLTALVTSTSDSTHLIDPWSASRVLEAIHNAAARIYAAIRRRADTHSRIGPEDRAAVGLGIAGAFGGSLTIEIRGMTPPGSNLDLFGDIVTPLDLAMTQVVSMLGEDDLSDERLVDVVLTSTPVLRHAVRDLVSHDVADRVNVTLSLNTSRGQIFRGSISGQESTLLRDALNESEETLATEILHGVIDGYRTSRKVFFFIDEHGQEIEGVIDENLGISDILQYADRNVEVEMSVSTTRARGGGRARKHFRLMQIRTFLDED
jgi:hypothetical protein